MLLEDMLLRSLVVLLLWTSAAVVDGLPRTGNCKAGKCTEYSYAQSTGRTILQVEDNFSQNDQVTEAPLIVAAKTGSAAAVRQLLSTGVDVNEIGMLGHTALWEASRRGIPKMVDVLLKAGADPDIANENGMTPLYMASEAGSLEVVKALVRHGADIEFATSKGATPILMAAQAGNEDIVVFLINKGAIVSARKTTSEQSALWSAAFFGFQEIVKTLVQAGANPDEAETSGATASYAASQEGQIAALMVLIEEGANVTLPTKTGATPLHVAAAACQVNIVGALLLFGGNPLTRDSSGRRPINSMCRGSYSNEKKAAITRVLQFAASTDKGVTLENVIAHGVEFQPEILEWIKRLLNPNTIAYLADHSANQEAVQEQAPVRRSRASGSKLLYAIIIPLTVIAVLAMVFFVFASRKSGPSIQLQRTIIPRAPSQNARVYTLNPLAHLQSESMTESVRAIGWLPLWRTPQLHRPTGSRAQDVNPGPLPNVVENSGEFSRQQLLEWLKEPQAHVPSLKWDLEPQFPEAAKSEASISSNHDAGVLYRLSQSLSSSGGRTSRKKSNGDLDSQASEELSWSQGGPSDQRRLWRIDSRSAKLFSSRRTGSSDLGQKLDLEKGNEKIHSSTGTQLEQSISEPAIKDCEMPDSSLEPSPQPDLGKESTDAHT